MGDKLCDAVVLAGGFGTRLKPLTASLPKPMVPVGNRPLMEHVIGLLARHQLTRILVLLFFEAEKIIEHFGEGERFGVSLRYLRPEGDFGTAGSVRQGLDFLADRFLVISGDVFTDIDLTAVRGFHAGHKAEATIVLSRQENPLPFGIVMTASDGRITRFLEKPTWGEVFSDTVNTGIYVIEKPLLAGWPDDLSIDFSHDVFPQALAGGRPLYGMVSDGYWRDVGHVDDYALAHIDLLADRIKVDWPAAPRMVGGARLIAGDDCAIAPDALLSGTVILGDRVSIGPLAQIADSVIGSGSVVGQGARIRRSILWSAVSVGVGSDLNETVVQSGVRMGNNVTLRERTIVSDLCRLGNDVTVQPNCRIWPGKTVEDGARVATSVVWGEQYNRELFADAKVSGLTNREVTPEFAARLGAAFASQFPMQSLLVVARDQSVEARAINEALKSGIASSGVRVRDLRDTIVPILRYDVSHGGREAVQGGVYIRRAPYHRQITDIIFFDATGFDLSGGASRSVERVYFREDFRRAPADRIGVVHYPERTLERYREDFAMQVDQEAIRRRRFRIVVDYSNGAMAAILPPLLAQLGIESVALNGVPSDIEPFAPDQAHRSLSRIVTALGYDLGVHINPAGEKTTLIDSRGGVLAGQALLLVVTELFWRTHPGAVVAVPVVATQVVERQAVRHNGRVERLKSDHLAMMVAAASGGVDLVAGTRGGFIFPGWQRGADSAVALVRIMEMIATADADLERLAADNAPGAFAEETVACPWNLKGALMRRLMETTGDDERELIDGLRIRTSRGWLWAAPDRRTAAFRLLAEGVELSDAKALIAEYSRRLAGWRDQLEGESGADNLRLRQATVS